MTRMLSLILVCVLPWEGFTEEPKRDDAPSREIGEQVLESVQHWLHRTLEQQDRDNSEPLGKTVKLVFQMLPAGKDDRALSIVTATRGYRLEAQMRKAEQFVHFTVAGQLRPLDRADRILVLYETSIAFNKDDSEAAVQAAGSAELTYGKAKTLLETGDKSLTVTATTEE